MNKVCMSFLTKDRIELSKQSIAPLLQPNSFDLMWVDGSSTEKGRELPLNYGNVDINSNVRGGAGAAIVFALSQMLASSKEYTHVGLIENDVLCDPVWFDRMFDLFRHGLEDGLQVGAVSARCYVDRVLFQREGYAVCHNLGAGMVLFTRAAAKLVLDRFRSGWTTDNRRIFCQISGVDIGPFYAFKGGDHHLVADWHFDVVLAAHGYSSLALTPSPVQMIGQDPPLAQQGLTIVTAKTMAAELFIDPRFSQYCDSLSRIREGRHRINVETKFQQQQTDTGVSWIYLPHQLHMIGGSFSGDWRFKEMRAFGEFGWVSGASEYELASDNWPRFSVPVYGNAMLLVSGGKNGGTIHVKDESSGYEVEPYVPPEGENQQCLQIPLPTTVSMRTILATFKAPGLCFYRLVTKEQQPDDPMQGFDYSYLPEPV